ncbi:MAG: LOG family protein [Candidatus Acidiferrales bacterium]
MAQKKKPRLPSAANAQVVSEKAYEVIDQALLDLWKVVDDLWQIRAPQPEFYRVTIFGSSRVRRRSPLYNDVRRLAAKLSAMGCDIVTGAGPGLMQAANEGVRLGDPQRRVRSYGLAIQLPHEQEPNPFVEKAFMHRTFFTRLHHFVLLSSAFVVVPGGIGTTLETMLIWQLLQVRHAYDTPLVLVGEMWQELVRWARRHMASRGPHMASPRELAIPTCVRTVEEAVEVIRRHHRKFLHQHSAAR